jgi:hypothetical protein
VIGVFGSGGFMLLLNTSSIILDRLLSVKGLRFFAQIGNIRKEPYEE